MASTRTAPTTSPQALGHKSRDPSPKKVALKSKAPCAIKTGSSGGLDTANGARQRAADTVVDVTATWWPHASG